MQHPGEAVTTDASRGLLGAVAAMGGLQLVMLLALYATRLPALKAARVRPQAATPAALAALPTAARNVAANHNNLFEAPTLFFAVVLAIAVTGRAGGLDLAAAWTYVALRAVHSAIQATANIILWRFTAFSLSWLVLGGLLLRCAYLLVAS